MLHFQPRRTNQVIVNGFDLMDRRIDMENRTVPPLLKTFRVICRSLLRQGGPTQIHLLEKWSRPKSKWKTRWLGATITDWGVKRRSDIWTVLENTLWLWLNSRMCVRSNWWMSGLWCLTLVDRRKSDHWCFRHFRRLLKRVQKRKQNFKCSCWARNKKKKTEAAKHPSHSAVSVSTACPFWHMNTLHLEHIYSPSLTQINSFHIYWHV